jgi:23S rRNA pseudouridine1911/1915/1917 synthase
VRSLFGQSWGKARGWIETGKIFVGGVAVTDPRSLPGAGARVELRMNAPKRPASGAGGSAAGSARLDRSRIVHLDSQIIVVDKPPGISTVPYDRNERGTLQDLVCDHLRTRSIEVVHRIDKETSGLVVFARTREAARALSNQFRFHTVHRRYLALVHGEASDRTYRTTLVENRGDGLRGSAREGWRLAEGEGQEATTHVRVRERLRGATLVECALETGRTHQIRIHLSEDGHPLLGEKLYSREFSSEMIPAPRVMLHAAELGFTHPASGGQVSWKREAPADFLDVETGLRPGRGLHKD